MSNSEEEEASGHGEVLKANTLGPDQVRVGMEVMSINGHSLGKVKEVRANDFLLDRPLARDRRADSRPLRGTGQRVVRVVRGLS